MIASRPEASISAAGSTGSSAIVAMSTRSKVLCRGHAGRPRTRRTMTQAMAMKTRVAMMPATLAATGQSGRVPQSLTVPRTSQTTRSGAALASIAGSEL